MGGSLQSIPYRRMNIVRLKDPEAMKGSGEDIDVSRILYRIAVTVGVLTLLF